MITRYCRGLPRFRSAFRPSIEFCNVRYFVLHVANTHPCQINHFSISRNVPIHRSNLRFYSSYPDHVLIKLPNLSPTMETGTIVSWAKNEGDKVDEGDLLAEIETDKATMSFDASDAGVLAKILIPSGTKDIPVGTPLCVMVEDSESISAFKDFVPSPEQSTKVAPQPVKQPASTPPPSPVETKPLQTPTVQSQPVLQTGGSRIFASPLARRMAAQQGIDLALLSNSGTGMRGMIRSTDLSNVQPGMMNQQQMGFFTDLSNSTMRAVIAKRLTESKQTVPHAYFTFDIEMDALMNVRSKINQDLAVSKKSDVAAKISLNDIFIKAVSLTCLKVPQCNSAWHGDFIRQYNTVDVSVAVATPSGLITPIIFGAEMKGFLQINREMKELVKKANENKLQPHEFQGGTFTISNLGMFSVNSFAAIINPPQACILAISSPKSCLLPDTQSELEFRKATMLSVTLSCDHRVVDGAVAVQWLGEFKSLVENPSLMLI